MAYVSNSIGLNDYVTGTLRAILRSMNMMISTMQQMDRVSQTVGADGFSAMHREVSAAYVQLEQLENQLRQVDLANQRTGNSFGSWSSRIMGAWGALELIQQGVQAIGQMTNFADEFTNANARLSLVRDDGRTQEEFQRQILALSNSTRSSYTATAALVARMGRSEQFRGDNEQAMRFADIVNKSLTISGAGTAEASSVVTQLSQAMSSGVLRGEEFNAVMENGSRLAEAMAAELGVGIGALRQMAMDGELTSDVVADAIMRAGEVIDAEFERMPVTFGQNIEIMKNTMGTWLAQMAEANGALGQLNQMFTSFNSYLMSESGQAVLSGLAIGLSFIILLFSSLFNVAGMVLPGVDQLFAAIGWSVENTANLIGFFVNLIFSSLPVIAPILIMIAGVFLTLYGRTLSLTTATMVQAAWSSVAATATNVWSFATIVLRNGITMLNVALRNNPIGMIVTLVLAVIVAFGAWQVATNGLRQTFSDVFAGIVDITEKAINFIIESINGIIGGFNKVGGWLGNALGFDYKGVQEITYRANFQGFKEAGQNFIENFTMDDLKKRLGINLTGSSAVGLDNGIGSIDTVGSIGTLDNVGEVGKIRDDVNIADEDLKLLEDLIIQNRVNQINVTVQTRAPQITNNNTINTDQDFDAFLAGMVDGLDEAVQVSVDEDYDI
ncbi:MAG: tape measure protein [Peptococcaceae bacterium]